MDDLLASASILLAFSLAMTFCVSTFIVRLLISGTDEARNSYQKAIIAGALITAVMTVSPLLAGLLSSPDSPLGGFALYSLLNLAAFCGVFAWLYRASAGWSLVYGLLFALLMLGFIWVGGVLFGLLGALHPSLPLLLMALMICIPFVQWRRELRFKAVMEEA